MNIIIFLLNDFICLKNYFCVLLEVLFVEG